MKSVVSILLIVIILLSFFQLPAFAELPISITKIECNITALRAGGGTSSSSGSTGSSGSSHHSGSGTRGRNSTIGNIFTLILFPFLPSELPSFFV